MAENRVQSCAQFAAEMVELTVQDTGIGMDRQTRLKMFEPFITTKGEAGSVGMVLPVVDGTVSRHHGRIEVDSAPGTTASQLPLRVVVVDDKSPVREVAGRMLRHLGYQVTCFARGFEAGHSLEGAALTLLDKDAASFMQKPFTLSSLHPALVSVG